MNPPIKKILFMLTIVSSVFFPSMAQASLTKEEEASGLIVEEGMIIRLAAYFAEQYPQLSAEFERSGSLYKPSDEISPTTAQDLNQQLIGTYVVQKFLAENPHEDEVETLTAMTVILSGDDTSEHPFQLAMQKPNLSDETLQACAQFLRDNSEKYITTITQDPRLNGVSSTQKANYGKLLLTQLCIDSLSTTFALSPELAQEAIIFLQNVNYSHVHHFFTFFPDLKKTDGDDKALTVNPADQEKNPYYVPDMSQVFSEHRFRPSIEKPVFYSKDEGAGAQKDISDDIIRKARQIIEENFDQALAVAKRTQTYKDSDLERRKALVVNKCASILVDRLTTDLSLTEEQALHLYHYIYAYDHWNCEEYQEPASEQPCKKMTHHHKSTYAGAGAAGDASAGAGVGASVGAGAGTSPLDAALASLPLRARHLRPSAHAPTKGTEGETVPKVPKHSDHISDGDVQTFMERNPAARQGIIGAAIAAGGTALWYLLRDE